MARILRFLGSLTIAVPLLITIAVVLAWGTIYEASFGTAAVQRFIYHSWWFQTLLGFLAVNLALAALERWPWRLSHLPFLLAHLGIICILLGGIVGGTFGIDGQMIIPEGEAEHTLQIPENVLVVHQPNPGLHQIIPTNFETQAWVHEPRATFPVVIDGRSIQLTVDQYFPDAITEEEVTDGGSQEQLAVHLLLNHQEQEDALWLVAGDPERFGAGWGDAHVLAMRPATDEEFTGLTTAAPSGPARGVLTLTVPRAKPQEIPVPEQMNQAMAIRGTPYQITFKEYFPDFVITEKGPATRSDQPNNPAVAFVLMGPEGTDAYLLFALHPDIAGMHGWKHVIPAQASYRHSASAMLPPNAIVLVQSPAGKLVAVMTGQPGQRQLVDAVTVNTAYTHPWLGYEWTADQVYHHAQINQRVANRGNEIKAEMVHVVAQEGSQSHAAWLGLRELEEFPIGREPILVEYRPAQHELPYTVKLLDFRKVMYPGIDMAAGFESDVELSDPQHGVMLMRTIKMNHPLKYRRFTFYQSSYIEGPTQTTVLSVRNDPGTPLVYAGFLIVILGVVAMFVGRRPAAALKRRTKQRPSARRA